MSVITSASAQRRIVLDKNASPKARLKALAFIERPSLRLLTELLRDPKLPSRLRVVATACLELALTRAELRKDKK
jgi:hypothetical protein